jgi:hypothetical protein
MTLISLDIDLAAVVKMEDLISVVGDPVSPTIEVIGASL